MVFALTGACDSPVLLLFQSSEVKMNIVVILAHHLGKWFPFLLLPQL